MMGQNAVLQLCRQAGRKAGHGADPGSHHFRADDNVPQELSVVCIVIFREYGKLFRLADIVKNSCSYQQIPVDARIVGSGGRSWPQSGTGRPWQIPGRQ